MHTSQATDIKTMPAPAQNFIPLEVKYLQNEILHRGVDTGYWFRAVLAPDIIRDIRATADITWEPIITTEPRGKETAAVVPTATMGSSLARTRGDLWFPSLPGVTRTTLTAEES